jgi:enoyl-CoA hydratase/carnithine racemase
MSERVSVSIDGDGVASVRLDRPDKRNACDLEMLDALSRTGAELAADRSLRTVVLSGAGPCFCAGLDTALFSNIDERLDELLGSAADAVGNRVQRAAWVWAELPVPVIAAVHGAAFGAGLQIALAADLRVVAPDAQLAALEIAWGLIPDMGGAISLERLVGLDVAKLLVFTGRPLSGSEARARGLASELSETPLERALELAREIARCSPDAVRAAKRLFAEVEALPLRRRFEREAALQRGLIGRANQREVVRARREGRAPRFRDPD